jgi:ATP-dependent RNA helicase DeaD
MSTAITSSTGFSQFGLSAPLFQAIEQSGYEIPTPIQVETIPHLLAGRDLLGQAQTGTGKTAAFALPLLSRIDPSLAKPQILVLTPTRELAIQVAESFQRYSAFMEKLDVLAIYGGQAYDGQLRQLRRGVHVVVGTPGRLMDHMRRGTLDLDSLKCLVLDEADEMLRMGFAEDVQWILERCPAQRQTALFSATLPGPIRNIAQKHLTEPEEVMIEDHTITADTIRQRFLVTSGPRKAEALMRILEGETTDGVIVFVKTKNATLQIYEELVAKGYRAAALNGDIAQNQRERTVARLKSGKLDILVATDVAARGLDVQRISHVVNFDLPFDTEAYIHRVGRTGRAGRSGEAILFVTPREKGMLRAIERVTNQQLEQMQLPSAEMINARRVAEFQQRITQTLDGASFDEYTALIEQYVEETEVSPIQVAAALAKMAQGDAPLLVKDEPKRERFENRFSREPRPQNGRSTSGHETNGRPTKARATGELRDGRLLGKRRPPSCPEEGMERFRIEVGRSHGVGPNNIVGAIAAEAGLDSANIGRIDIFDQHSTVDLPDGMPRDVFRCLKRVWVSGRQLRITRCEQRPTTRRKQRPGRAERQAKKNRSK